MIKKNKEFFILILILLSGIIIIAFLVLFQWIADHIYTLDHFWWILISYIIGGILFYFLQTKLKHQIFKYLFKIWIFPILAVVGLIRLSVPFFVIQVHLMYYVIIAVSIPVAFYFIDKLYDITSISNGLYTYIILTFSVIVGTIFNKQIKHLAYIFSPFRIYYSEKLKKYKFKELTDYLISENNVRFMIYISYFIYLLLFNIFNLQNQNFYSNPVIDKAVLQSFITFIAFDSVLRNFKTLEFKPSEMLNRIFLSITGEDKQEEKN
jgi:hypothetical protein